MEATHQPAHRVCKWTPVESVPFPCHLTFSLLTLDERSHVMLRAGVAFLQANLRLNDKMQQFNSMNKAAQVRKGGR